MGSCFQNGLLQKNGILKTVNFSSLIYTLFCKIDLFDQMYIKLFYKICFNIVLLFIFYIFQLYWLDADVICLQEVDPFYFPHLVKSLAIRGYQGLFQPHTSIEDGVAMFF